jgi:hypothetical protein
MTPEDDQIYQRAKPAMQWRRIIRSEYAQLVRACESSSEADRLLDRAYDAALSGERRHRRGTGRPRARLSCDDTARWFVLKWVAEERPERQGTALSFAFLREDAFCGYAIRDWLDKNNRYPFEGLPDSTGLEYVGGIIRRD